MTTRSISRSVVFARPFTMPGLDGTLPAGTYVVETDEERIEAISVSAYRRTATWLRVPALPGRPRTAETALVDPDELAAALARDNTVTKG
ncbi:MAG TPA: hypothetical protein VMU42_07700 [Candidatus Sulfotelmatobacter sp.]|nr:hypothetical protein [Candidatus Sulfotelmatobacter sp.]